MMRTDTDGRPWNWTNRQRMLLRLEQAKRLRRLGYSAFRIAEHLGITERWVFKLLKKEKAGDDR